jgi:hypothetical protein
MVTDEARSSLWKAPRERRVRRGAHRAILGLSVAHEAIEDVADLGRENKELGIAREEDDEADATRRR